MAHINRNGIFLLGALAVGSQIPTTIEKIADPTVKVLVQLLAVLILIFAAIKVDLRRGFSDYPPPRKKEVMKGGDGFIELGSLPPNWKKKPPAE